MSTNIVIIQQPIPDSIPDDGINVKSVLYQVEKEYFIKALEKTGGNREEAARLLGINPPAFRKALRERFEIDNI